jgi:glycosyltransferase involved in cell wall biosynthesis
MLAIRDKVTFTGYVDEETKQRLLAWSWVMLAPSVKEGWGLMVTEAAAHGVPAVAFRGAGGLDESILDGRTGLLADDFEEFVAGALRLLTDERMRIRLGEAARSHTTTYSWRTASCSVLHLLQRAASGLPPIDAVDPAAPEAVGAHRQG